MTKMNLKVVKYCFIALFVLVVFSCSNTPPSSADKSAEIFAAEQNYDGSVFKDLKALVWQKPYDTIPLYKVDSHRIHSTELANSSVRTLDSHLDIIDSNRPKIVHPNGICLSGEWQINPDNPDNAYTGYFTNGSAGLILARISTFGPVDIEKGSASNLTGKEFITYGLIGKIFPTLEASDPKRYHPANFFIQTDLGGQTIADVSDVEMTNAPDVTAPRRGVIGGGVEMFAKMGITFASVDKSTTIRQLYEIAELAKPSSVKTNTPQYLKLVAAPGDRKKVGQGDFRKTLQDYIKRNKQITFDIYVANAGYTQTLTPLIQKTVVTDEWKKIGSVVFSDAVASQVCDFNLHFHHPSWRKDRNDPDTAIRHKTPNA